MKITKRIAVIAFSLVVVAILPGGALAASSTTQNNVKQGPEQAKEAEATTTPQAKTVTVQTGDYLEKIAQENQSTSLRLFYANTSISNPDLIFPNQQLKVPTPEEQLTPREVPANQTVTTPTPSAATQASAPATNQRSASVGAPAPSVSGGVWDRLASCEAGGNWHINTGNGYYGGLQFSLSSWRAVGGSGLPSDASREEQIMRGKILQARAGWGSWPACSAKLGLR